MASKKGKTVDKWKKKQWYEILAPTEFKRISLGDTVATKPEQVKGRTIKASLRKITNQIKRQFVEVLFRITEVKGNNAYTESAGHEIPESFLKKFIRRRSSKIQLVQDCSTKDKAKIRVKTMVLTARKATANQRTAIRAIIKEEVKSFCAKTNKETIISEFLLSDFTNKLHEKCKKIMPVKRVEVTKTRIYQEK
ncbi:MAG: hypothetical protein ABIA76_00470 [Candidatus Diapherotrites archaeon]